MSVVGIDFGNEASTVAVARHSRIDVLQNEVGRRKTPTMVAFSGKQRLLGDDAQAQASGNAKNTVTDLKRLIGRSYDDPEFKAEAAGFAYKTVPEQKRGGPMVEVYYNDNPTQFKPEQIVGALLVRLKKVAEKGLENQRVNDVVIGVPAYWTDMQRRALLDAANIAGLNVLRLMNESTAVALNYGILRPLPKEQSLKVLFFDCGHAHTQVSLVSFQQGKLTVLAHSVDRNLGGRNFDYLLMDHFAKYILDKYKLDVMKDTKARFKLQKECNRVKTVLSANNKVNFNVEYIMNDTDVKGVIDRAEFEAMAAAALLPRFLEPVKAVLEASNTKKEELASIEIVGGGSRIPSVQKVLTDFFGKEMSKTCDSDESVARGCALQCAMLSPNVRVKEFEVHDISTHPIELHWGPAQGQDAAASGDNSTVLFEHRNPIPSVKMISFKDRTQPFNLTAKYADPSGLPKIDPVIGTFTVSGMPALEKDAKAPPKIKVRVKLGLHTTLSVPSAQLIEELPDEEKKDAAAPGTAAGAPAAGPASPTGAGPKVESEPAGTDTKGKEGAAPMDTAEDDKKPKADAAAAGAAGPESPKTKKRVKRTDLKIDSNFRGGFTQQELQQAFEQEVAMSGQDQLIIDTKEARNALESYALEMRGRVQAEYKDYIKPQDAQSFIAQCQKAEEWLYEDGFDAQKSEYKKRLEQLKVLGDPAVSRQYEHQTRNEAVGNLKKTLARYQTFVNSNEEKYAHIEAADRKKVADELAAADKWLTESLHNQDKLALSDNPVITVQQMKKREHDVENVANPIMNKPKPPPPAPPKAEDKKPEEKKPEAKKEEKPAEANGAGAGAGAAGAAGGADGKDKGAAPMDQGKD